MSGIFGTTQVASAAPTVTYPGAISNISLTNDSGSGPLTQWQKVRITGDWAVPAGAVAGETFGMTLPEEFSRLSTGSFTIADPDTGAVMANCIVDNGQGAAVVCTLTDAVNGLDHKLSGPYVPWQNWPKQGWRLQSLISYLREVKPSAVAWADDRAPEDSARRLTGMTEVPSFVVRPNKYVGLTIEDVDRIATALDRLDDRGRA